MLLRCCPTAPMPALIDVRLGHRIARARQPPMQTGLGTRALFRGDWYPGSQQWAPRCVNSTATDWMEQTDQADDAQVRPDTTWLRTPACKVAHLKAFLTISQPCVDFTRCESTHVSEHVLACCRHAQFGRHSASILQRCIERASEPSQPDLVTPQSVCWTVTRVCKAIS